jgi:hypothetical protein
MTIPHYAAVALLLADVAYGVGARWPKITSNVKRSQNTILSVR